MNPLIKMFLIFVKIGTFTLGGGYAMIPLIEKEIVEKSNWIKEEEFIDIIALAQTIPGALAINTSTYIGYRLFGIKGALVGCIATMLPSMLIILFIANFFIQFQDLNIIKAIFKGIRPAVVALIVVSVLKLSKNLEKTWINILWVIGSVVAISLLEVHPILIIVGSSLLGYKLFRGENNHERDS